MNNVIHHLGLDVHKETIAVAIAPAHSTEVRQYGIIGSSLEAVDKLVQKLAQPGVELRVVYEAGPCGFVLCRHLRCSALVGPNKMNSHIQSAAEIRSQTETYKPTKETAERATAILATLNRADSAAEALIKDINLGYVMDRKTALEWLIATYYAGCCSAPQSA